MLFISLNADTCRARFTGKRWRPVEADLFAFSVTAYGNRNVDPRATASLRDAARLTHHKRPSLSISTLAGGILVRKWMDVAKDNFKVYNSDTHL